ncbi:MAG: 3-deoxy-manno-octulosonate cytidylyltransferase [Chitinophagaceae bacterium]|nr:3-deoxy-manno-octulosonate cytidylyltransferase [Chitinophagaceae bacterium]
MKKIAVIPARFGATRFPGKLMQRLGTSTVIAATYLATKNTGLFDDVLLATDSEVIAHEIKQLRGNVFISKMQHESGSDRIAEAIADLDADVIVNVQGDMPFVKREPLQNLLEKFSNKEIQVASLMEIVEDELLLADPNCVKVCVDNKMNSLLFSRSIIPYRRSDDANVTYYKHIGVYAFRKEALLQFTSWPVTQLENAEKLENLRWLENGVAIKMVLSQPMGIDINTPDDLVKAQQLIS